MATKKSKVKQNTGFPGKGGSLPESTEALTSKASPEVHKVPAIDDYSVKANPELRLFEAINNRSGGSIKVEAQNAYRARNYAANHFGVDPTSIEMKPL